MTPMVLIGTRLQVAVSPITLSSISIKYIVFNINSHFLYM